MTKKLTNTERLELVIQFIQWQLDEYPDYCFDQRQNSKFFKNKKIENECISAILEQVKNYYDIEAIYLFIIQNQKYFKFDISIKDIKEWCNENNFSYEVIDFALKTDTFHCYVCKDDKYVYIPIQEISKGGDLADNTDTADKCEIIYKIKELATKQDVNFFSIPLTDYNPTDELKPLTILNDKKVVKETELSVSRTSIVAFDNMITSLGGFEYLDVERIPELIQDHTNKFNKEFNGVYGTNARCMNDPDFEGIEIALTPKMVYNDDIPEDWLEVLEDEQVDLELCKDLATIIIDLDFYYKKAKEMNCGYILLDY